MTGCRGNGEANLYTDSMSQESVEPINELPRGEFAFPGPLRDVLVSAILDGSKTSTSALLAEYPSGYDPNSDVGTLEAVVDSRDNVVCVIRTTHVRIVRLGDVGDAHAVAEGEGYANACQWRAAHEEFWRSREFIENIGEVSLDDDTLVVCSSFAIDSRYPTHPIQPWVTS